MSRLMWIAGLLLVATSFFVGTIYAGSNPKIWSDPDAGRTPAEVEAAQKAASDAFWARYPQWIEEQVAAGVDPATLPSSPILASVIASAPTLSQASSRAAAIVRGTVTGLEFRPEGDTVASFAISKSLKGKASGTISIHFAGGLQPWPDWNHPTIGFLEAAPIPMPGSELVLFLDGPGRESRLFEPQMYTGLYHVNDDGTIEPLEGNPFAGTIVALNIDAFSSKLAEHIHE